MSPSSLLLFFHFLPPDLGSTSKICLAWMHSRVNCKGCGHPIPVLSGNMCANYDFTQGTSRMCLGAWHDKCYLQLEGDHFPVLQAGDLDDALMDREDPGDIADDPNRFKEAWSGDYLMCRFQCNNFSFFNIRGRYPGTPELEQDKLLLLCIRRANLDSFWARERRAVARNQTEMQGLLSSAQLLGIRNPLPPRGPYPVGDSFGMGTACSMLIKTLQASRNAEQIQFETARKLRSAVSNFIHTTPYGVGASTIGYGERRSQFFSGSPTKSQWFKRFMIGCHCQMGDVWVPDKAVTVEEILAALFILYEEYQSLMGGQRR
ncbi:hypothetical protein ACA910_013812 [Epithemia clementina (nom. ined.)]